MPNPKISLNLSALEIVRKLAGDSEKYGVIVEKSFSGATFIAGAIGFELIGGKRVELYGEDNFIYCLIYTCEEFLEMLGIVIFNYALITYITEHIKGLKIAIKI